MNKIHLGVSVTALSLVLAACGGASGDLVVVSGKAFSQEVLNDEANAAGQKKVLDRLAKQPPAAGTDAVVAVTGTAELTGVDLTTGKTWSYKHPLEHRSQIAGTLVIGQGGGEIVALDAKTGAEKWKSAKPKGKLIGAGSDGMFTAVTMKTPEGSALFVFGADGSIKFDKTTEMSITVPGGLAANGPAHAPPPRTPSIWTSARSDDVMNRSSAMSVSDSSPGSITAHWISG